MPKEQPMEQYTPKGLRIPIPTRGEFDANLDRVLGLLSRRKGASPTEQ
jgi:hypothetical protein